MVPGKNEDDVRKLRENRYLGSAAHARTLVAMPSRNVTKGLRFLVSYYCTGTATDEQEITDAG
jgi:hypothetical protein